MPPLQVFEHYKQMRTKAHNQCITSSPPKLTLEEAVGMSPPGRSYSPHHNPPLNDFFLVKSTTSPFSCDTVNHNRPNAWRQTMLSRLERALWEL